MVVTHFRRWTYSCGATYRLPYRHSPWNITTWVYRLASRTLPSTLRDAAIRRSRLSMIKLLRTAKTVLTSSERWTANRLRVPHCAHARAYRHYAARTLAARRAPRHAALSTPSAHLLRVSGTRACPHRTFRYNGSRGRTWAWRRATSPHTAGWIDK